MMTYIGRKFYKTKLTEILIEILFGKATGFTYKYDSNLHSYYFRKDFNTM